MRASRIADTLGRGILAGLAGTAAMTVAQMVEMKVTGRRPSDAPAKAVQKVAHVRPTDQEGKERLSNVTHWAYGTAWGVPRAALGAFGVPPVSATLLHFATLWGAALTMLPALRVAPPASQWDKEDLAKDAMLHLVYAAAAGAAVQLLDRRDRGDR